MATRGGSPRGEVAETAVFSGSSAVFERPAGPLQRFDYSRFKLGTRFRIVFYAAGPRVAEEAAQRAFRRVDELDLLLSDFRRDSELSQINDSSGEAVMEVSPELVEVFSAGLWVSRVTGGAFDVTVGPLVGLWRAAFGARALPRADDLRIARSLVGFDGLELDPPSRGVRLRSRGMKLDLGGIAKGFIADEVAALLRTHDIRRFLVDAGGDITCGAPPPGRAGWTVSVEACGDDVELVLANRSLASSGDRYRFILVDGVRYSHIVDPRTGYGVPGPVATAALAPSGMLADAIATSAAILEESRILKLVSEYPEYEICVSRGIEPERRHIVSPGIARLLQDAPAPH